jgi:pseudouridine-5'-phosphate glycosidase
MLRLQCSDDVARALRDGGPLVALETTILSHGMPYPENLATAHAVEAVVRGAGATPATIAVIDGTIRVGLDAAALERLATQPDVLKLSRADLPFAIATGATGATTVAATMLCAHRAGIGVFATGGIGGVHRGAERSMDVSADLYELARTPVTVVCAGAKALLDIPKTLEVLETLGVPTIVYGSDEVPAFWSRASGIRAPLRLDAAIEIASFVAAQRDLGISGGAVIANPVEAEHEIPRETMSGFIEQAVEEAERGGITGKALTPWLLDRIYVLSGGASLRTNIALVKNNARLAAAIAAA